MYKNGSKSGRTKDRRATSDPDRAPSHFIDPTVGPSCDFRSTNRWHSIRSRLKTC